MYDNLSFITLAVVFFSVCNERSVASLLRHDGVICSPVLLGTNRHAISQSLWGLRQPGVCQMSQSTITYMSHTRGTWFGICRLNTACISLSLSLPMARNYNDKTKQRGNKYCLTVTGQRADKLFRSVLLRYMPLMLAPVTL